MSDSVQPQLWLLFSSCPDTACAERIARALIEQRLAACVQLLPAARSLYRWNGVIEQADEVLLQIKTCSDRIDACTQCLRSLHPYELPELVAVAAVAGLPAYLDWVRAETRPAPL